jgi:hypothetical protein
MPSHFTVISDRSQIEDSNEGEYQMARIKWLHHPTNPKLNGTSEHVSKATADYAVTVKQAEHFPFADFRERLAFEGSVASGPGHTNPNVPSVEWGVDPADPTNPSSKIRIIKRLGSATTWFSSPPPDAPLSILKEFAELTFATHTPEMLEAFRVKEALENNQRNEVAERERKGTLATLFSRGGK